MDTHNLRCSCGYRPVCITMSDDGVSCEFLKPSVHYKTVIRCEKCGAKFEGPVTNGWFEARKQAMKEAVSDGYFEYEF